MNQQCKGFTIGIVQNWPLIMQVWTSSTKCRDVSVLLFDAFSNHCLANAVEPLRAANMLSRRKLYRWCFLSLDGEAVTSSSGLPVQPEMPLGRHPGADYLFVMPSYGFETLADQACSRALRTARNRCRTLVGMDTGSWLLAAAGVLDGRKATIHWDELVNFQERFPEVDVVEDRVVIEEDLMTCGGATTTFEMVLRLIESHHGPMLRLEVASIFMHGERFPGQDPVAPPSLRRVPEVATAIMRRNIETPLKIAEVAGRLGLSQKMLESVCQQRLGMSPRELYRGIRLREARRLLEHTRMPISEISVRTGYTNASAMARAFRNEFGLSPTSLRAQTVIRVSKA